MVGLTDNDKWEIITRIPRDATTELQVKTGKYWNIDVIDIRWFSSGKPTKKGVRVNIDELITLTKALNKIVDGMNIDDSSKL